MAECRGGLDRERKEKGRPLVDLCFGPYSTTVTFDYAPHNGQSDAGSLVSCPAVQSLEHAKYLVCILHLKADLEWLDLCEEEFVNT